MTQIDLAVRELVRDEIKPLRDQVAELVNEIRSRMGQRRAPQIVPPTVDGSVTRRQAASELCYSVRTITRLIDSGRLRTFGARRNRIARFEIERFKAEEPRVPEEEQEEDVKQIAARMLKIARKREK